ncbi:MAG: GntR family transcriptional regulator [Candidatus Levybacteria bacterium]|nr:GntR family transcriptional regulator [Candidatus Levybacteria bacterium]
MRSERFEITVADSAAELFKNLRKARGASQPIVANIAGVSRSMIAQAESGSRNLSGAAAFRLARGLGAPAEIHVEAVFSTDGISREDIEQTLRHIIAPVEGIEAFRRVAKLRERVTQSSYSQLPMEMPEASPVTVYQQIPMELPENIRQDVPASPSFPVTKAQAIAAKIQDNITTGKYPDGRIPTHRQIAEAYTSSLTVARQVLKRLRDSGAIVRRGPKGHWVTGFGAEEAKEKQPVVPLHRQITDAVRQRIINRQYTDQLPRRRTLANEFHCSVETVTEAMKVLNRERLVISLEGLGVFIDQKTAEELRQKREQEANPSSKQ